MSITHRDYALGCLLLSSFVFGAEPVRADWLEYWEGQDGVTGNWGGVRDDLKDKGVEIEATYTTDLMALVSGGESGGEGRSYAGRLDWGVTFDLEKLVGLSGATIVAQAAWSSGQDLSDKDVGNTFPVAQIFTGQSVRMGQLYWQQELLNDSLEFKIGRLTTEEDFLASDIYTNYVNGGINGTPFPVPDGNPGFTTAPFVQWGTVIAYKPTEDVRTAIGFYNAGDRVNNDSKHGIDFSLDPGDNMLMVGEVDYKWNATEEATGLPGNAKFGALYETGHRDDLPDGERRKDGNYGFYVSLEQKVYQESEDSEQGLTPWAAITWMPRDSVNQMPVFLGLGAVYTGLIPTRDKDNAAIGFLYGNYSSDIPGASSEKVFEFNYTAQLMPWFYVRPDLQYIIDPAGSSHISDAVVMGGEIGVVF